MNAYRLFALLVAAAVTSAATGQPTSFRGKVVSFVFHIPMEEVDTMSEQATYTSQFRGYDTLEVMTFLVCNDTMRYTSVLASDDSLRLYQVGKTTLLYSDLDEGYLIYPKLSAFHEGVTGKDWRRYRKRHNPLKLNYRVIHPFHRQYVSYTGN